MRLLTSLFQTWDYFLRVSLRPGTPEILQTQNRTHKHDRREKTCRSAHRETRTAAPCRLCGCVLQAAVGRGPLCSQVLHSRGCVKSPFLVKKAVCAAQPPRHQSASALLTEGTEGRNAPLSQSLLISIISPVITTSWQKMRTTFDWIWS